MMEKSNNNNNQEIPLEKNVQAMKPTIYVSEEKCIPTNVDNVCKEKLQKIANNEMNEKNDCASPNNQKLSSTNETKTDEKTNSKCSGNNNNNQEVCHICNMIDDIKLFIVSNNNRKKTIIITTSIGTEATPSDAVNQAQENGTIRFKDKITLTICEGTKFKSDSFRDLVLTLGPIGAETIGTFNNLVMVPKGVTYTKINGSGMRKMTQCEQPFYLKKNSKVIIPSGTTFSVSEVQMISEKDMIVTLI